MATTKEMIDDAELAKSYITNSSMSDDYKRTYLRLINVSTMATNGISPEEKIQKMTECIQLLAITQGMYLSNIDDRIEKAITTANNRQCSECIAMKHALEVNKEKHDKELIDSYMKKMGIDNPEEKKDKKDEDISWTDVLKNILMKPYIYVVLCLISISPYGVEIVKAILSAGGK